MAIVILNTFFFNTIPTYYPSQKKKTKETYYPHPKNVKNSFHDIFLYLLYYCFICPPHVPIFELTMVVMMSIEN